MTFALPPIVAAALLCGFLPLTTLFIWARLTGWDASPGKRFVWATALSWAVWAVAAIVIAVAGGPAPWQDIVVGGLILSGASVAGFILWSLLAWGFTASLLLALARSPAPLGFGDLVADYTGGGTLASFLRNRLGVLLRFNLAHEDGGDIVAERPAARAVVAVAKVLRRLFGLRS